MEGNSKEWFSEWFDSPFYHILYKNRDFEEARAFIDALSGYLHFQTSRKALDVACGRGRHAVYLHGKSLTVDGIDLSPQSIEFAKQYESEDLHFYVHDMRKDFRENQYDYVLNLFTSFGYFDKDEDNVQTIKAFSKALKKDGVLIIDFLNPECMIQGLVPEEIKIMEGISFSINRKYENGFIVKNIAFEHQNKKYDFEEKVRALRKEDFINYFNFAGLTLTAIFGNYKLEPYDEKASERMIFIAHKK